MRKTRKTGASVGLEDWASDAIAEPTEGAEAPPRSVRSVAASRDGWKRHDGRVCEGCGLKFSPRAFALHRLPPGTFDGQAVELCVPEVELDSLGLFCFNADQSPRWFGVTPFSVRSAWERFWLDLQGGSATPWQIVACRPDLGLPGTPLGLVRLVHAWAVARQAAAAGAPPSGFAQSAYSIWTVLGDTDHLPPPLGPGAAGSG